MACYYPVLRGVWGMRSCCKVEDEKCGPEIAAGKRIQKCEKDNKRWW